MEHAVITISDEAYDNIVHGGSAAEKGDLVFAIKARATVQGNPAVAIGFTAVLKDGTEIPVQCIVTGRIIQTLAVALNGVILRNAGHQV